MSRSGRWPTEITLTPHFVQYSDKTTQFRHNGGMLCRERDPARAESGAAAVEFALVSTLLFTVMFGIMQYGLFFNDALSTRQGVVRTSSPVALGPPTPAS